MNPLTQRAHHRPLPAHHAARVLRARHDAAGCLRALRTQAAAGAQLSPGGGPRAAAGVSRGLRARGTRVDRTARAASDRRFAQETFSACASPGRFTRCRRAPGSSPNEPVLRLSAPLPEAQLVESRLINLVHYSTVIASPQGGAHGAGRTGKTARGLRPAPVARRRGGAARRALGDYLAGFLGAPSAVSAGMAYGIPVFGTMAHSFVQAHEDEAPRLPGFRAGVPAHTAPRCSSTLTTPRKAHGRWRRSPRGSGRRASRSGACGSTAATWAPAREECAANPR